MSTSNVTEEAQRSREALRAEVRDELAALERYEAQHGSFPELVRAHYERDDGFPAPTSSS